MIGSSSTAIHQRRVVADQRRHDQRIGRLDRRSGAEQHDRYATGHDLRHRDAGAGNDTLRAHYDVATGQIASITGTIDGGAGTDTLIIGLDADAVFTRTVLPTNFELLGFDLSNAAVATLAPDFTAETGI